MQNALDAGYGKVVFRDYIAKSQGKYKGRQPTARRKTDDVLRLLAEGKKKQEISDQLNIGIASVYRVIAAHKNQQVSI